MLTLHVCQVRVLNFVALHKQLCWEEGGSDLAETVPYTSPCDAGCELDDVVEDDDASTTTGTDCSLAPPEPSKRREYHFCFVPAAPEWMEVFLHDQVVAMCNSEQALAARADSVTEAMVTQ